jgi:monofunctional biosynthetic peptidoglycan transglycosylase
LIKTLVVSLIVGWLGYEYAQLPAVSPLKTKNPKTTALMELRDREYRQKGLKPVRRQLWVPYGAVSEHLKKAILLSEDAAFFSHGGVDLFELKEAAKEDWDKKTFKRGASTITMQLAKNLYLNPSKNPLRKLREIVISMQLESTLSKRRIFEIYLNVVEWGMGIYGVEAAARHYFLKAASDLTPLEAATLAALLPNPRGPREKSLLYRRNLILTRMLKIGYIGQEEFERATTTPLFYASDRASDLIPYLGESTPPVSEAN